MSLRDINLKESYESGIDDLVNEFYTPVLKNAVSYDRIAGFFTSTSFAVSARGIYNLIENEGKIRLLVSPKLSEKDVLAIENAYKNIEDIVTENISKEIFLEENEVIRKHHKLLTWLIKEKILEIKIVLVKSKNGFLTSDEIEYKGLFHQKIGIIRDKEDNIVTFSGSINETFSAWNDNVEEFKVFRSWEATENKYCDSDIQKFSDYWDNKRDNLYICELPELLEKKLIEFAPEDISDLVHFIRTQKQTKDKKISLFYYQEEALKKWLDNEQSMLFEMATGTGKTRTAIACIEASLKQNKQKIVVISTPQSTLSLQWKKEMVNLSVLFESSIVADGTNRWKNKLLEILLKIRIGVYKNVIIYTTHATSSSSDFTKMINDAIDCDLNTIFVGDEVHALGSKQRRKALLPRYKERIGLSATPSRWFDKSGSLLLENYFNNCKYEFTISDALKTINPLTNKPFLSQYYYYPCFTTLSDVESEKYVELTAKINRNIHLLDKDNEDSYLDKLLRDRADIIKHAINKISVLREILMKIKPSEVENTIIFVSYAQVTDTVELLNELEIRNQLYTQEQGSKPEKKYGGKSEREYIIDVFKKGLVKVLVAIRCLDEGIDIPTADTAILVSSTTNPREYIQRVGRVIRQSPQKKQAYIYDMIINPSIDSQHDKKIMDREFNRIESIAFNAKNNAEVLLKIYEEFKGGSYGN